MIISQADADIQIRTMSPSEVEMVGSLHEVLFSEIEESKETFKQHVARPQAHVLVAHLVSEKKLMGYSLFRSNEEECDLNWLGVSKDFRKRGVGSLLMQATVKEARQLKFKSMICFTRNRFKDALRLYLKTGFDVVGTFTGLDGDLMIKLTYFL